MGKRIAVAVFALVTLLAVTSASAFDGNRKGFFLSVGLGGGMNSFTQTLEVTGQPSTTSDRENKGAFATDFKIGGGFNEQFLLYYVARSSWFSITNVFDESVTILNQIGGVGATYYLSEAAKSAYFLGAVGLGTWSTPFESGGSTWIGFGLTGGVGYEFAKHWGAELAASWSKPSDEEGGLNVESNTLGVLLTIQWIGY